MSKWRLFLLIVLTGLAADQVTKFMAVDRLTTALSRTDGALSSRVSGFYTFRHLEPWSTEPYVVWKPMWRMRYAENPGAAWGLFRDLSLTARNSIFSLTLLGAVAFILVYFRKLTREQRPAQVALSLVFAGAIRRQVARVVPGRSPRRAGVDRRHPQHGDPLPPAGTCLSLLGFGLREAG